MAKRLKWVEFDYTVQLGPRNEWFYRPLLEVDVSVRDRNDRVRIFAMLDSGTDGTVLHSDVAKRLNIDPTGGQKVRLGGIGSVEGFLCNVQLSIPDFDTVMEVPVIFAEGLPLDGLLGQRHFFQRFKVRFEKDINKFYMATT